MKKFYITLMLIFIFSIGAVCAQDLSQADTLSIDSGNEMTIDIDDGASSNQLTDTNDESSSEKTLKDLNQSISSSVDEFNMTSNYAYDDGDEDLSSGIHLGNITINGNNNTIDCKGKANAFIITDSMVVINDLTLKNCKNNMISVAGFSNLTLNNVCFIDDQEDLDSSERDIIYAHSSFETYEDKTSYELDIHNCTFYSTVPHRYDILSDGLSVEIADCEFSGSAYTKGHARILNAFLVVNNSTFNNLTAKYATAVYTEGSFTLINNSRFYNLNADLTAGAIGIKYGEEEKLIPEFYIEKCEFENVTCKNDGGAVYIDAGGTYGPVMGEKTTIRDCSFKNCNSSFGGAVCQLFSPISIENCNFSNNYADIAGGAIYTCLCDLNLTNCILSENIAGEQAGAIYFDDGKLNIVDSIINGSAVYYDYFEDLAASTLYAYNGTVNVEDSIFENEGMSIIGVFSTFKGLDTEDKCSLNNTDYDLFVSTPVEEICLINNTINVDPLPSRFDLREWGWVTPVRDQGHNGACWAFGALAALESVILKATGMNLTFSPNNLQNFGLVYSKYGSIDMFEGGDSHYSAAHILNWISPLGESDDEYDEMGKVPNIVYYSESAIHIQNAIFILGDNPNLNEEIKKAIIKYGAIEVAYGADHELPFYNKETFAMYGESVDEEGNKHEPNHAVAIVGWDDDFSADNFIIRPPGDGAWIVKNSWGDDWGNNGYFYLSYYDESFMKNEDENVAFAITYFIEDDTEYDINYQTDFNGIGEWLDSPYYSNEYTMIAQDYLAAVGTYFFDLGTEYSFKIFLNDELVLNQSGINDFIGFKTIKLDKYIPVEIGDNVRIEFKNNGTPIPEKNRQHLMEGVSFISDDGIDWRDASENNETVCLKLYTASHDKQKSSRPPTRIDYKNMTTTAVANADGRIGQYFTVTLKDENGTILANKPIKIGFNGKVYNRTTNENGSARLQINLPRAGIYTFAIGFLGDDDYYGAFEVAKITVNPQTPKLTTANKSYKSTAKTKSLTASFKTANGNPVSGKKISFTINGKTYTASTNAKGVATVKVSLNKKGTYSFTVKFAGDNTFKTVSKSAKLTLK